MTCITFKGTPINTLGTLPEVGTKAIDFQLTATDLSTQTLADFAGENCILSIFPSLDTQTCANSVETFSQRLAQESHLRIICISRDLPFAQGRFAASKNIENIHFLSDFKTGQFGRDYGLEIVDGPLAGLLSRCVIAIDASGTIRYTQQVAEVAEEPDYTAAFDSLK